LEKENSLFSFFPHTRSKDLVMANKVLCYPPVRTQWGRGAGNTEVPREKTQRSRSSSTMGRDPNHLGK